jgi:hypothetical protein
MRLSHDFVREGRIVGHAVRDGTGEKVAVAILVLEPLPVEGRAACSATKQKASRAHVAGEPGEIADTLQPEHRIKDIEGDHRHIVGAVGRRSDDPARHRAALVDPLL